MSDALLTIDKVCKSFGGFAALTDVSITVAQGERFGLIGPNGSGKTTLINCVSGALRNDAGTIAFAGENVSALPAYQRTRRGIARSFQIPRPFSSMTVLENLVVPLEFVVHRRSLHKADTAAEAMVILKDMGLADLNKLRNLTILNIDHTGVTDGGLKDLATLARLTNLGLGNTRTTDAGLKHLSSLKNLNFLQLSGTEVTADGVAELRKALPTCNIFR